jgi:SAM-dependent methyltransferase
MNDARSPTPAEMYESYFGPAIFIPWCRVLLEHAEPKSGERVLDLACGTGIVARHVAPRVGGGGSVVGLDINPGMLEVARGLPAPEGAPIQWREGSGEGHDLPDDAFDLALCQQGFQFFSDHAAGARELHRVLAPGGRAVLNVWQGLDRHPLYRAMLEAEARHLGVPLSEVDTPFSLGDADVLRGLFEQAGFRHVQVTPRTLDVRFPSPDRFLALTLMAAAAVIPAFAAADEQEKHSLVEAVRRDVDPVVNQYRDGDHIVFPMTGNLYVARA